MKYEWLIINDLYDVPQEDKKEDIMIIPRHSFKLRITSFGE